ncbi:hypothetical protein XAC3810_530371 [Xanthomonas citri pv. citri]|uniref:Uncharacterized protein n=1 Tax=Xanthomonas citri pv. citri TaxID=611301 RepID=A0A0U5BVW6_XANCI|nr:hypothetical protein XAC9322_530367 [Xanthomonas citri pv. citri]CEE33987.1 hypothetical protein XAC3824_700015 [Xanthomonas citri pv. citri]CEE35015.1 hypothetical protein XAC1083_530342 [Xanthomonas citri pv. citri]CEE44194.1 hypothetical protein XAC3810_530371 [Xanthomonas citri pv. citri]CEE45601.1 hypothetical protein XAC902_720190 [Xanthomonas citri pv. citri]
MPGSAWTRRTPRLLALSAFHLAIARDILLAALSRVVGACCWMQGSLRFAGGDHLPDVCCAIRVAIENLKETIDAAVIPLFRTPVVHRFDAADDRDPLPSCQ